MQRPSLLALVFAAPLMACGAAPESNPTPTGVARESISGGYVDDKTTGVVGLAFSALGHQFFGHCSGTLIAPNLVLTAHHCVALTDGTPNEQVQCGVSRFTTTFGGGDLLASPDTVRPTVPNDPTFFRSVEVRIPPGGTDLCGLDVALVFLAGSGMPADLATPIEPRVDASPAVDEKFSAEGFGLLNSDQSVDTSGTRMRLDDVSVRCVGAQCAAMANVVRDDEWVSLDAAICPGDSGGPALDSTGRVIGVASRASNCSNAVYGDVASWHDFLVQGARDAAARGGYPVPSWAADASASDAGTPRAASGPLGQACSGACSDGYACYSDTGKPPGICVPHCGSSLPGCPAGYTCSDSIGACTPDAPSSSCAVSSNGGRSRAPAVAALGLAAVVVGRLRRRRVRGAGA